MNIIIPEMSLVALIGTSGAGKSTFARKHFRSTEVLSSDYFRGLVSDDENAQDVSVDAFDTLHYVAHKRLTRGRIVVVDATNVQPEARRPLVQIAREHDVLPVAIVLDVPEHVCVERNRSRPDRAFGPHVVRHQRNQLRRDLRRLEREGFRHVYILNEAAIANATIEIRPLWNNRKLETGPFDIIGDVHGCFDELEQLLLKLGYTIEQSEQSFRVTAPAGRRAVFVGDLVDRGPKVAQVLQLVMDMVEQGVAVCVPGNHEARLLKSLRGKNVKMTHGLDQTLEQMAPLGDAFKARVAAFIGTLVSHYVFDDGRLVVAHAGMKAAYQGRASGRAREFALYGETTGETDEYGLPIRHNWAAEYRGRAAVVYGHTPVPQAEWLNNTICLDTGCVFGGALTALRYPERELVSVKAASVYAVPIRPLLPEATLTAQQAHDDVIDLTDVGGKRIIATRAHRTVTIREENAAAALEVMSRFAIDPRWLIYLPPTMSPSETAREDGYLEHPADAFAYFRREGVATVVCEEKHMGSRAVVVVCRSADAARQRFGTTTGEQGVCYTRTGRRFFTDATLERAFLDRIAAALTRSGFWDEHQTDWVCLDCELMPWSAKAAGLLRDQYAAVGAAARAGLDATVRALASANVPDAAGLLERMRERQRNAYAFVASYRGYAWPTHGLSGLKLAPFHVLATEGAVHTTRDHVWHMEAIAKLAAADEELIVATPYRVVQLDNEESVNQCVAWWTELTQRGGEGVVVKPRDYLVNGPHGLVQPALKTRGREYLRLIYGPDYTLDENLTRLRKRGVSHKRSMALRELALGIESLERFVERSPLRRVHECVFGVLALESEPVDPRL